MNRPEQHHLRRRADGRRRVGAATGWAAAAGGGLAALFGVLLAQTAPATASAAPAAAEPELVAPSAPAPSVVPAPLTTTAPHRKHATTAPLRPPAAAPRTASGSRSHAVSGAS